MSLHKIGMLEVVVNSKKEFSIEGSSCPLLSVEEGRGGSFPSCPQCRQGRSFIMFLGESEVVEQGPVSCPAKTHSTAVFALLNGQFSRSRDDSSLCPP